MRFLYGNGNVIITIFNKMLLYNIEIENKCKWKLNLESTRKFYLRIYRLQNKKKH